MKQLKFMLAAATAVGIAVAAQAASLSNTPLVNDTFDSATLHAGYSYNGAEGDNESSVKDGVLEVNTGTDPLLRALDFGESARDINLGSDTFDSLVIDTKVQFTVTPAGDEVKPSKDADGNILDKLMIYLAEATNDTGVVIGTNLMVKAASYIPGDPVMGTVDVFEPTDVAVTAEDLTVSAGGWYDLNVVAKLESGLPVFTITLNGKTVKASRALFGADDTKFPSLAGIDGVNPTSLTYVGFAGEGKVDDLKVNLFELATSVDFTLALGEGVSAVEWTINGNKKYEADGASFDAGTTIVVSIDSVTYAAGYAGTQDWTAWTYNKAESGSIEITAEKFAEVSDTGVVTPTADTIAAAADGAFACPASGTEGYADAVAKLGKAVTWATSVAKKSYNDAMTFIKDMDFADVTTNDVNEAAYLFNCEPTPAAVATEAAAFKFPSFTKDMTIDAMKAAVEADKNYNGTVEIHGATTLENGGNWAKGQSGSFYKAVLTK